MTTRFKRPLGEKDVEAISRTMVSLSQWFLLPTHGDWDFQTLPDRMGFPYIGVIWQMLCKVGGNSIFPGPIMSLEMMKNQQTH